MSLVLSDIGRRHASIADYVRTIRVAGEQLPHVCGPSA
jgi:hypothetical protein